MEFEGEPIGIDRQAAFSTTHWSMVLAAGDDDPQRKQRALACLCQSYWYPVYAFIRRQGHPSHDAQDLTQGFFAGLLKRDCLGQLDRSKGKFRSFLLASVKNHLTDNHRRQGAEKRGGKAVMLSIDDEEAEARYSRESANQSSPDKLFERSWVVTLLERVMNDLEKEQERAGKAHIFERLKVYIGRDQGGEPYKVVGERLGLGEEAVKKAVQRLRQRYGVLLRAEVANTVLKPEMVEEELAGLLEVWR